VILQRLMQIAHAMSEELRQDADRASARARQAATALACVAVAAGAMPVMAHRAEEQRQDIGAQERSEALLAELERAGSRAPDVDGLYLANLEAPGNALRGAQYSFQGQLVEAPVIQAAATGNIQRPLRGGLIGETPTWKYNPETELHCLSQAVYYEARGESLNGQYAVAEVVINRVRSRHYPDSICGVVFQGSYRRTGCQFTFTCDGSLRRTPRGAPWERAQRVARDVIAGAVPQRTGGATHYHTDWVDPHWNSSLIETTRIGTHIFYRMPRNSERALYASSRRGDLLVAAAALTGADAAATPTLDGVPLESLVVPVEAPPAGALPPGSAPMGAAPVEVSATALPTAIEPDLLPPAAPAPEIVPPAPATAPAGVPEASAPLAADAAVIG